MNRHRLPSVDVFSVVLQFRMFAFAYFRANGCAYTYICMAHSSVVCGVGVRQRKLTMIHRLSHEIELRFHKIGQVKGDSVASRMGIGVNV